MLCFFRKDKFHVSDSGMREFIVNRKIRILIATTVKQASQQASTGMSLPNTLIENNLVLSKRMQQTLSLAETAGTTEKAIRHELELIQKEIKLRNESLISWWPKALYVGVLLVVMRFMF